MKKKLLVFTNYYGKKSETFISDEISFLSDQENVDLTIMHYGSDIPDKNITGINFSSDLRKRWFKALSKLNGAVLRSLRYKNGLNGALASLIPFFHQKKFDTIYCHFGTNGKLIAQLKTLGVISIETKLVVRFHGLDMNFTKYPVGFYDILNSNADHIIVGSEFAFQDLCKYQLNQQLIDKLPVGIEKNIFTADLRSPELIYRIVSVGRLIELKGYLVALQIMNELHKRQIDFSYTIVGDGPQYDLLCDIIAKYQLQDKVKIIKGLEHEKVLAILKESHIYLYPGIKDSTGRVEAQGLANLESMASGLVILASDIGGVPDYVIDGKTGFLCESENIAQFAEKLLWIIENYNKPEMFGIRKNAVKMVEDNYSQEYLNSKLLKLLTE